MTALRDGTWIAALLTPRGRGAVASVRLQGPAELIDAADRSLFVAANGKQLAEQPIDRIVFGRWGEAPGEDVVLCRIGESTVEIHCHGGDAAVNRILADLERRGCRIVTWQEAESASCSLLELECREALAKAATLRTAGILLDQQSGTLRAALEAIRNDLKQSETQSAQARIGALLDWANFGRHLTEPWHVVILGRPNVGKSSLLNALAGYERAIVFDEPGTTRDLVTAEIALQGWPVRLIDTAGIREADSPLESAGIELARRQARDADLRLIVVDASQPLEPEDFELVAAWPDALLVANKSDLPDVWGDRLPGDALRISTLAGNGIELLTEAIPQRLIPRVPPQGTAVPVAPRQFALAEELHAACQAGQWEICEKLVREMLM